MPHGPRISDDDLRSMARERIADGRLPVIYPHSIEAGYGSGASCRLCGQPIHLHQIEYELSERNGPVLFFHLACYGCWQLECRAWGLAQDGQRDLTDHQD